jgi:hypothetical protein
MAITKFAAGECFRSEWFKGFEIPRFELQSLTVGIEHFIIRQKRTCKKQPNKRSQNSRVNAPSAAFVRLSDF